MNSDADEVARLRARLQVLEFMQELLAAVDNHDLRERPGHILRGCVKTLPFADAG